jgi:hypothetical protein
LPTGRIEIGQINAPDDSILPHVAGSTRFAQAGIYLLPSDLHHVRFGELLLACKKTRALNHFFEGQKRQSSPEEIGRLAQRSAPGFSSVS